MRPEKEQRYIAAQLVRAHAAPAQKVCCVHLGHLLPLEIQLQQVLVDSRLHSSAGIRSRLVAEESDGLAAVILRRVELPQCLDGRSNRDRKRCVRC